MVEGLRRLPGAAGALGLLLQVAPREVDARGVAPDVMRLHARWVDVPTATADGHDQFDLVAEVGGARRVGQQAMCRHHGVRGFHEPGRHVLRWRFVGAPPVVAADAEHAAHGKARGAAGHGQGDRCARRKDEVRHGSVVGSGGQAHRRALAGQRLGRLSSTIRPIAVRVSQVALARWACSVTWSTGAAPAARAARRRTRPGRRRRCGRRPARR
jgi:hypothetical protein